MKKFFLATVLFLGVTAQAQDMMIMKGGFGFLYPDFNSFTDPSHLTMSKGSTVEARYGSDPNQTPSLQDGKVSFATSSSRVGFQAYVDRSATDLTNSSTATDTAGAALALDLVKDRVSLGVSYDRGIGYNQTDQGTVNGSLLITGGKGTEMGPAIAFGAGTNINSTSQTVQTGTVAVGYAFKHNSNIEADLVFNDTTNLSDYTAGGYMTLGSQMVYFGAGYTYTNLTQVSKIVGRFGINLGKSVDISVNGGYQFNSTDTSPTYGGSLRFSF